MTLAQCALACAVGGHMIGNSGASLAVMAALAKWRGLACEEVSAGTDDNLASLAGLDDCEGGDMTVFPLLQLVAGLFIIVGAILGIIGWTQIPRVRRILLAHMVIGLILLAFVVLQVAIALGRPSPNSNLRYGSF